MRHPQSELTQPAEKCNVFSLRLCASASRQQNLSQARSAANSINYSAFRYSTRSAFCLAVRLRRKQRVVVIDDGEQIGRASIVEVRRVLKKPA